MGREIRRVPADWDHPKHTEETAPHPDRVGDHCALYDEDYETAAENWIAELMLWQQGKHPDQPNEYGKYYWDWNGEPPSQSHYRERKWTPEEATHFQMYETVSEGSPVTPRFETKAELVDYLVENGDYWDQRRGDGGWLRTNAESFVESEWAPSMMMTTTAAGSVIQEPRDGMA